MVFAEAVQGVAMAVVGMRNARSVNIVIINTFAGAARTVPRRQGAPSQENVPVLVASLARTTGIAQKVASAPQHTLARCAINATAVLPIQLQGTVRCAQLRAIITTIARETNSAAQGRPAKYAVTAALQIL